MSFSSYNPHNRYRRRKTERLVMALIIICGVVGLFAIGFWFGKQFSSEEQNVLKRDIERLHTEYDVLQDETVDLMTQAKTADMRYEQLQDTYADVIEEGAMQDILLLVRKQLDEGMDPRRLSFVLRSARPPQNCSDPETRRFVLSTPVYEGADNSISIADGALTITGSGISARGEGGKPEAWFDPSRTIKLAFKTQSEEENKSGVMPLHHSMVVANREYRFTIEAGAKSFVKITFDSCDYP